MDGTTRKLKWAHLCVIQAIFEHEGVFIHPGSDEDGDEQDLLISGSLKIVDKVKPCFMFVVSHVVLHYC